MNCTDHGYTQLLPSNFFSRVMNKIGETLVLVDQMQGHPNTELPVRASRASVRSRRSRGSHCDCSAAAIFDNFKE